MTTGRRKQLFLTPLSIVTVIVLATTASGAPLPGQIVVDPDNRSWLYYTDGKPFFLASPGDPEGFLYRGSMNGDGTRSGDQVAIINKLADTGANGIYMQIIRSNGGDGDSTHNPFVDNDPSKGLNEAVLAQWDTWFEMMDAAGIVIYLFIYDDSARIWNTGDTVEAAEAAFVAAIVNRFKRYKHLIWVVAEEYAERYSAERVANLAAVIRDNDEHEHPIAVHKNNGLTFDEFANDPNIDQFALQYNVTSANELHAGVVEAYERAAGRYNVNMSEATEWGTGAAARHKAWASALGGAYVMGLGMDIASTPVSDLNDLGRLRTFMESTNFDTMSPRDDLSFGATEWVLANPGTSFIAYGRNATDSLGLAELPQGEYTLHWLDTVSGDSEVQTDVPSPGGNTSFDKPAGFGTEVALYAVIEETTSPPKPLPPTDLQTE